MIVFCPSSDFRTEAGRRPLRCPITSEPLEFGNLPPFEPDAIDPSMPGHWRYLAMLPVVGPGRDLVTLGEGWTPLIPDRWRGVPLYWKLDAFMPTGSYKDRGVSVMVNWLLRFDVHEVVDDSSGNAGASLACYAGRAGLDACIFVPESTPSPKKAQIAIYGADLVEVPGSRDNAAKAAKNATQFAKETVYASHAWHPAFLLGQMTLAWEIWEQLGRRAPDWLLAPTGHGSTLLGAWRGFQQLQKAGLIEQVPRLVAVQAHPYTPIYEAFRNRWDRVRPRSISEETAVEGIAISNPIRDAELLAALYRSQGTVISVSQEDTLTAQQELATHGFFVEPSSATVCVAAEKMKAKFGSGETVVAVLTGHGLKNPPAVY